jgi:micrococcal nuclease
VRVEFGPLQGDQYGRILYYVYDMDGESIDEMLVREGLALAWLEDGQHQNVLIAAEGRAKENGRGCLGGGSEFPMPGGDCDSSYLTVCIPSPPPDLDCGDIQHRRFNVEPPDPHGFDRDGDGVGCES